MEKTIAIPIIALLLVMQQVKATEPVVVVTDIDGSAGRIAAPVSFPINLAAVLGDQVKPGKLQLVELVGKTDQSVCPVPVQFVPESKGSKEGTLWWLMMPGPKGERCFRLTVSCGSASEGMSAQYDKKRQAVDVTDGKSPVLRYNYGTVPPPPQIVERYEKQHKPTFYYARSGYIHPVFGPDGEELTEDYSLDHPHHRGVFWAWPVVRYRDEVRDIWAIRVLASEPGGIWSRPVAMRLIEAGPVLAVIEVDNVWKWADKEPVVSENVIIRAFRQSDRCRFIDVEVRLIALVDGLSLGGRPHGSYGGFTFRTYPKFDKRNIDMHIEGPESKPRRAWYHLTGNFPGGKGLAGVALLEHISNPDYPSYPNAEGADSVPGKYPNWRTMQPAWPGDREVALPKGKPLVLKHRLWVHPGLSDDAMLTDVWETYAKPPKASLSNRSHLCR